MKTTANRALAAANSVNERLHRAVVALATGRGDVRSRLETAGLTLLPLQISDFPVELQDDFRWVLEQLTRHEALAQEGRMKATLRRIQNSTGEKIASRIFDLYEKVQLIRGNQLI